MSIVQCEVTNDVNYDLSIGTNWSLDMFIASTTQLNSLPMSARASQSDSNMFPAQTSTKGFGDSRHYFSIILVFEKHLNIATGVVLADYNG